MWDFSGRKVVVTGGASGIGRTVAEMLQQAGAEVHIFDLTLGDADTLPGIFHQVNIRDTTMVPATVGEQPRLFAFLV